MDAANLRRESRDEAGSKTSKKMTYRHSKRSIKILKEWLASHREHPYPTEDEKRQLSEAAGMTTRQISYWFINSRRRSNNMPGHSFSDLSARGSFSIAKPPDDISWNGMAPLDRWHHSPPEEEPASWSAISQSVENNIGSCASYVDFTQVALPSSQGSSAGPNSSGSSGSSAYSYGSECLLNFQSNKSRCKRRRRRHVSLPRRNLISSKTDGRIFQCTFCTDTFQTKYDWTRHEGAVHLNLEKWTCLLFGPKYCDQVDGTVRCVLCDEAYPTEKHVHSHKGADCASKPLVKRTFYRRDHLRQHLRVSHNVSNIIPSMKQWRSKVANVKSRCGFCGDKFVWWPERNDHLAEHFRSGAHMRDWKGCRGLEPAVALLVQHAMPPYLIGAESVDPEPFSGTRAALQTGEPEEAQPTRFELLTAHLGEFVNQARAEATAITDEGLRQEARTFLYGDDDPLNHTPADNLSWLGLFKQGYGLTRPLEHQRDLSLPCIDLEGQYARMFPINSSPFTPEKMQQAARTDSTFTPLDRRGSTPNNPSGDAVVPWRWQTPECLAEFSQMSRRQPSEKTSPNNSVDMTMLAQPYAYLLSEEQGRVINDSSRESSNRSKVSLEPLPGGCLDDSWMDLLFHDDLFQV